MTYMTLHNELASLEDIQTWLKLLFMKYSMLWAEIMNIKGQTETTTCTFFGTTYAKVSNWKSVESLRNHFTCITNTLYTHDVLLSKLCALHVQYSIINPRHECHENTVPHNNWSARTVYNIKNGPPKPYKLYISIRSTLNSKP